MSKKRDPEGVVREIKRKTRRRSTAEEKIRIGMTRIDEIAGEEKHGSLSWNRSAGGSEKAGLRVSGSRCRMDRMRVPPLGRGCGYHESPGVLRQIVLALAEGPGS